MPAVLPLATSLTLAAVAALAAAGSLPAGAVAPSAISTVLAGDAPSGSPAGRDPARTGRSFVWPLRPTPRVLRLFAVGPYPWSPGHRGVDLAADVGQPVLAAGAGVVTFAGRVAGRGVVVVAHPGGLRTTYEPVAAGVRAGQVTEPGSTVGRLDTWPGHCAAPCLHWGALRGNEYVDPLSLLRPPALPVLLPDMAGTGIS
jgi:murein DD-endopeptidase MepM/ murein hydrolase activator NlpD